VLSGLSHRAKRCPLNAAEQDGGPRLNAASATTLGWNVFAMANGMKQSLG
jgi:hypothetical protein